MKIEQVREKMQNGDLVTLSRMLGVTQGNARMMFLRGKEEAVEGLIQIINQREGLIEEFKKDKSKQ